MLPGLALLIIVVGALQVLGLVVISGLAGTIIVIIFLLIIAPMSAFLMVRGAWLWFKEQLNKRKD